MRQESGGYLLEREISGVNKIPGQGAIVGGRGQEVDLGAHVITARLAELTHAARDVRIHGDSVPWNDEKYCSFWTRSITHKGAIEYHQNDVFIYTCTCTMHVLPIFRWSTPSPTLLMTPLTSWPRSSGLVTTKWPMPPSFQYLTSEPQIPTCWTAIWTSGVKNQN